MVLTYMFSWCFSFICIYFHNKLLPVTFCKLAIIRVIIDKQYYVYVCIKFVINSLVRFLNMQKTTSKLSWWPKGGIHVFTNFSRYLSSFLMNVWYLVYLNDEYPT